ncbi:penicillin-binding transpeptidase domain-containing protein [Actinomadura hibisca]|uniref:penicillin-binding transpeptidase domain-containing protein n=1 Tax=Actinomadura hibisca TaxID=68565 RepID=UPI00082B49C1|nr:penicillin-binding transpeptidase domain-containing protein [Actinomadura hibisca]
MRARGLGILAAVLGMVLVAGLGAAWALSGRNDRSPEEVAADYFAAWRAGRLDAMAKLVDASPPDFAEQHRAMVRGLLVSSIELDPRPVVRSGGDEARADFTVTRSLGGRGQWTYKATLRLVRDGGRWKVAWTPATLYPGLKGKAEWRLREIEVPAVTFTARDGKALPDSGSLAPYAASLAERYEDSGEDEDSDDDSGDDEEAAGTSKWAVEVRDGGREFQQLKLLGKARGEKVRTTVDLKVQAAADKALDGPHSQAALVALRPSTGAILAVGDRLGGLGAFTGLYPPGSTFKVVTAAALLSGGTGAGGAVDCPATVVTAQRTINNHEGVSLGGTSLREAFAQSCNTTFARLTVEKSGAGALAAAAERFGFGEHLLPGVATSYTDFPKTGDGAELAESAIGQGRVQATPLLMATVAAAVADGTWRSPRLLEAKKLDRVGGKALPPRPVANAAALRDMMRAVVTGGTAARAGLPSGTAGKTGTAETGDGSSHAWFIGYRGDLAFAVLVPEGGSGPKVAAPIAARFLRALP